MPEIIRLDGVLTALHKSMLANRSTGMGTSRDSFTNVEVGAVPILGEYELRSLHRGNWWIRRIVDTPAQDMVKAGVSLTHPSNDAELVQKVMALYEAGGELAPYSKKMGGAQAFQRAEMYARWFGRGYIVLRVNGNEKLEKPLRKVRSFEGFSVLDRYQLRPDNGAINYEDPEFYQLIRRYQSSGSLKGAEFGQRIHESRVLPFDGAFIHPYDINLDAADGAHDSVIQSLYECFCRHYSVQNAIAKGLDSYSLFKVAIANLGELMMQDEGEAALTKTLNAIAEMMSVHRILPQDADAANSEFQERSFTGVKENADGFRDEVTAASGLPHYKLWGSVAKSGLTDSGGAETRAWADTVSTLQNSNFLDNHRRVFNALFEAVSGGIPDGFEITYPSIYKPTPQEEAELRNKDANTYSVLIQAEVLDPLEVKLALATGEDISNVLDPEEIEQALEQAKALTQKQSELDETELEQSLEAATAPPELGNEGNENINRTVGGQSVPDLDDAIALLDSEDAPRTDKKKGKKRNCRKGISCGSSCISRLKTCRKTPTAKQAGLAQQVRDEVVPFDRPKPESKEVFGGTDHDIVFDAFKYAEQTGVSLEEADARFQAIRRFTGTDDYLTVRQSQREGKDSNDAKLIESYLSTAKKYDGEVYRGMQLDSVDDFYNSFGGKDAVFRETSMNSWSSDLSTAEGFGGFDGTGDKPVSVIFSVPNKSGSSIRNQSDFFEEQEVLVPKNVRYKIKTLEVREGSIPGTTEILAALDEV